MSFCWKSILEWAVITISGWTLIQSFSWGHSAHTCISTQNNIVIGQFIITLNLNNKDDGSNAMCNTVLEPIVERTGIYYLVSCSTDTFSRYVLFLTLGICVSVILQGSQGQRGPLGPVGPGGARVRFTSRLVLFTHSIQSLQLYRTLT